MLGRQSELELLHHFSNLVLADEDAHTADYDFTVRLNEPERQNFIRTAGAHRVLVRALRALENHTERAGCQTPEWILSTLAAENANAPRALSMVSSVCDALDASGFPSVVIKSLDHWPDLGSDFDVFAYGDAGEVEQVMRQRLAATLESKSLSDRLACKYRFRLPGLEKLVEIHLGRLGQTGQQVRMGRLLMERRIRRVFGGYEFTVPSPEDQILLRVIDRFYRRYCLRICDIVDIANVIQSNTLSFEYLKQESKRAGIRKGFCACLAIVDQFYWQYRGEHLAAKPSVWKGAGFGVEKVYTHGSLLRIPLFPQAAGLFTDELTKAIRRKDIKKTLRTGLIPALAVAAAARFRITGRDKGIW